MNRFGLKNTKKIYKKSNEIRKNKKNENCFNIDKNGVFLIDKKGASNNVSFSNKELEKINGCELSIHNHPKANSFSIHDISFMLKNNIKEIRVVGIKNDKSVSFSLKLLKGVDNDQKSKLLLSYVDIYKNTEENMQNNVTNKLISSQKASEIFFHIVMEKYSKKHKDYFNYEQF